MATKQGPGEAGKRDGKPPETAAETSAAVERIKEAVSDTKVDMAAEEAGTKPPHVASGWVEKEAELALNRDNNG
jgi:hypothetical protein